MIRVCIICVLGLLLASSARAQVSSDARSFLEQLERVGDDMETIQGLLQYDRRFLLQGDRHVRRGTLAIRSFELDGVRRREFEVRFDTLLLPMQGRMEEDVQVWAFNGMWLFEIRPNEKVYIARQLARLDQPIDPLRLGEGPIPIPIGQRAEDVLSRYTAEIVEPTSGLEGLEGAEELTSFVHGSVQLRLTPLPMYIEDDDFREIRLWYDEQSLLPRMSIAELQSGDISVVQLLQVRTNEPLDSDSLDLEPPSTLDGWQVHIEPLEDVEASEAEVE
ncbi:MAG: outer membrane lipoprotein carrier protein LolA [Phycisphaerales bacterium JB043]